MPVRDYIPTSSNGEEPTPYERFAERHNIRALPRLTVAEFEMAVMLADRLTPRIKGKTVVEIGGGVGVLSVAMGAIAKRVYCIEANPLWSMVFAQFLLEKKPKNVSFLCGAADEFLGCIKGDVAVICTHSDVAGMKLVGAQFAPVTIDVYGEMIDENPEGFDPWVRSVRPFA